MKLLLLVMLAMVGCTSSVQTAKADDRLRIYVLETKLDPVYLNRSYICSEAHEPHTLFPSKHNPHGANITEIIGNQIDTSKYCIFPINTYVGRTTIFDEPAYIKALIRISKDPKAVAVNMSMSGPALFKYEPELIHKLTIKIKVVVSAGNEGLTLTKKECPIYPACLKLKSPKLIVVSATDVKQANQPTFDHVIAPGKDRGYSYLLTGTSQAAAEHTASLFRKEK